jgi:hypothetical protein
MGYYSDVLLSVAVPKHFADTLLNAYRILPATAEHKCLRNWKRADYGDVTIFWAEFHNVKWYEEYKDVASFEAMFELCQTLSEAGDFIASSLKIRLGESSDDNHYEDHVYFGDVDDEDKVQPLANALVERFSWTRRLNIDCDGEPLEQGDDE